ncbi:MAG: FtsX-like permease family protein [Rickettsiales bacterium]|nr:FtsX-like permease family protein [Rickettsiales bacterium]
MRVFSDHSDINFSADDSHQFLPWLIGVMSFLAALLLCVGLAVNGWILSRHNQYSGSFTVNIPSNTPDISVALFKIQNTLRQEPGVADVSELDEETLKRLLKPWLGSNSSLEGLPLPRVLNVRLKGPQYSALINYRELQSRLGALAPGIEIDAHERWVQVFSDFSATVQLILVLIASLILTSMAAMVAFASRASLHLHAKTVHILHATGAEDDYIARQFQREAFRLVLPGAYVGCLIAACVYWIGGVYLNTLNLALLPTLALGHEQLLLTLVLPIGCAFAAWAVSSISVRQQLKQTL